MSQDSNLEEVKKFKMELASLNIESEQRDQIVRLFNEALLTSNRAVIALMIDNSINILHNNIEISKNDFKSMVLSFGRSNKFSLILEAYLYLVNLNGDQIYRVVREFTNKEEKDWECPIEDRCNNYQGSDEFEDFKIDLFQKLMAIKSTQEALIELSQKKDISVLDKLSDLLTQNNADLLLLSFSGITEENANSNAIISQVISIMNKVVFEPFAKQAEEILDLKRKIE